MEEWKTEEGLQHLKAKNPNRYCPKGRSGWDCPPGRAYAEPLGLYYRVRSSAEIDWTFQRNIQFLDDYLRADPSAIPVSSRETARAHISAVAGQIHFVVYHLTRPFQRGAVLDLSNDVFFEPTHGHLAQQVAAQGLLDKQGKCNGSLREPLSPTFSSKHFSPPLTFTRELACNAGRCPAVKVGVSRSALRISVYSIEAKHAAGSTPTRKLSSG